MDEARLRDGERVLWRGRPEPSRALLDQVGRILLPAAGTLVLVVPVLAAFSVLTAIPAGLPLFLAVAIGAAAWRSLSTVLAKRRARARTWTLTDRRLVIDDPDGQIDLRLANLPDPRVALRSDGSGCGTISFDLPSGAGPERYLRRLAALAGAGREDVELMADVPDAVEVVTLIRDVQARIKAAPTLAGPGVGLARPIHDPPEGVIEAPTARLPFVEAAAAAPLWFGGAFLVAGLVVMAWAVVMMATVIGGLDASGVGLLGLGGLFALLGGTLAYGRLRTIMTERHLRARGRSVAGSVVDVAATGIRAGGHGRDPMAEQWIVRYRYELRGHRFTGHTPPMPWSLAARYAAGDEVGLLVDPDHPDRSLLVAPG